MSKIGRKPIALQDVQVSIKGNEIHYKGKKSSGTYILPAELKAEMVDSSAIKLSPVKKTEDINRLWGLHRALLANSIEGARKGFEEQIQIVGLGFKASVGGRKVVFSLGFSHKINYELPDDVTLEVDSKTGQNLVVKGVDKERVGLVSSQICALRPTEPYKGTGIKLKDAVILRKAGKTKSAA
jgi:large subunit ribosomal protein L6